MQSLDSESLRKQSRFEVLPETLILHIGRFAFDYRLNQPVKMHTAVEYAHVLTVPRECLSGALSPQDGGVLIQLVRVAFGRDAALR